MKAFYRTGSLIGLLCCGLSQAQPASLHTKEVVAAMSRAAESKDIGTVLSILPSVEQLWRVDPEDYLKAVKQASPVLRNSQNQGAKEGALNLFTNLLDKTSPTNTSKAVPYFELKREIIQGYLNLDVVRTNKGNLLRVAGFVGEVRSHMIPSYVNRGTAQPGLQILLQAGVRDASALTDAQLKQAYEKAVKDNEQDLMLNKLQSALHSANEILTFHLLHHGANFSVQDPENEGFLRDLADSARFSAAERAKLFSKER